MSRALIYLIDNFAHIYYDTPLSQFYYLNSIIILIFNIIYTLHYVHSNRNKFSLWYYNKFLSKNVIEIIFTANYNHFRKKRNLYSEKSGHFLIIP